MSNPELAAAMMSEVAASSAPLPADRDGPVFAEPWQAEAFAMVCRLHEGGAFTWREWAAALSQEIARDANASVDLENLGAEERYYRQWLRALEQLVAAKGLVSADELATRRDAWEHAYLATPHGLPVHLAAAHDA